MSQKRIAKKISFRSMLKRSRNLKKLCKLLVRFSKVDVSRTYDGYIRFGHDILKINYYDAVTRIINNNFTIQDEQLYSLLRNHGITF